MTSVRPPLVMLALVGVTLASCSEMAPSDRPFSIDPRPSASGPAAIVSHSPDSGCRSFVGETVEAVAWSAPGDFLAVSTSGAFGEGRIRVFAWPDMLLVSESETDVMAADYAAIDNHGAVFWFAPDPDPNSAVPSHLWKLEPAGTATMVDGLVRDGPYVGLVWAGNGLISMEYDPGPPERWRLVKFVLATPKAKPVEVIDWTTRLGEDFWLDPSGAWVVWDESDGVGAPQDFIVMHDGLRQVVRPPGYGGRAMTLSPDRGSVIYQRSETARLTKLDLNSGVLEGELSPLEFYGGEVSQDGILAGLTAHGPDEPNQLCVMDVSARL